MLEGTGTPNPQAAGVLASGTGVIGDALYKKKQAA
jgi:hypothetical protein